MSRTGTGPAEAGLATVLGIGLIGLLVTFALVASAVVGLVDAHRKAQSAADLAALAGGGALAGGTEPCASAAAIAGRNGARLTSCRVDGRTVAVVVSVPGPRLLGVEHPMRARARAGPATGATVAPAAGAMLAPVRSPEQHVEEAHRPALVEGTVLVAALR